MIHPLTFLKGAGLGAGIMYFFDPVAGSRRRAVIRDQITQACTVCNDASDRLQNATAEVRNAMQSSDQPVIERMQEGLMDAGRSLGAPSTWSPTAKTAAMIGGAGLVASLMNKRDLTAIAFGIVGLSFVAKELAEQEQMQLSQQNLRGRSQQKLGGKASTGKTGDSDNPSQEKIKVAGSEASASAKK